MLTLSHSLVILLASSNVIAIKFSADGVSVPDGELRVNEDTELACRYILWKQERLYSVTWSIKYDRVKTDFFVYKASGQKEIKPGVSLVIVDPESAEDKGVTMRLTDDLEEVSICCDVKVLKDDGYGSVSTREKEKCSASIPVVDSARHPGRAPLLTVSLESREEGRVGESLPLVCTTTRLSHNHRLQLRVNGVDTLSRNYRNPRLEYMLTLQEQHFTPSRRAYGPQRRAYNQVTVECLVLEGRNVVANDTRVIRRQAEIELSRPERLTDGHSFYTTEEHQSLHGSLPCHSYLILREKVGGGSVLLGRVKDSLKAQIRSPRLSPNRYETDEEPVMLLNLLGFHGYRVVGVANSLDNTMVWTLEKKDVEMHDEL